MILCLPFLPRFPKFSLHQSSTNILSRMIYQMFTKAEVSTGSYTLSGSTYHKYRTIPLSIKRFNDQRYNDFSKLEKSFYRYFEKPNIRSISLLTIELNTNYFFLRHKLSGLSQLVRSFNTRGMVRFTTRLFLYPVSQLYSSVRSMLKLCLIWSEYCRLNYKSNSKSTYTLQLSEGARRFSFNILSTS